jgi:NAD(P)-dependent dehydrogenase (short-subunit alcohol dehydrogenase family)
MTTTPPAGLLQDKIAVVTGAGAGIGSVTAGLFVSEGAQVLLADISGGQEAVAADLGEAARPFQVDLTQEDQIEAMFAYAAKAFGRVDILVNVAGNPGGRRGEEITVEEYDSITSVHVKGTMFTNKHAARTFAGSGGGAIVNFSSAASFNIDPKISLAYSAAKAAVNSITKSYAVHYGPFGVRANAVAPGFTLSEKNRAIPDDVARELGSKASLGRAARSIEQAHVAAFLASDRASFVNGVTIPVDGGWTSRLA